jgi:hypothetical protein
MCMEGCRAWCCAVGVAAVRVEARVSRRNMMRREAMLVFVLCECACVSAVVPFCCGLCMVGVCGCVDQGKGMMRCVYACSDGVGLAVADSVRVVFPPWRQA